MKYEKGGPKWCKVPEVVGLRECPVTPRHGWNGIEGDGRTSESYNRLEGKVNGDKTNL